MARPNGTLSSILSFIKVCINLRVLGLERTDYASNLLMTGCEAILLGAVISQPS
jgi:hypothetical protein